MTSRTPADAPPPRFDRFKTMLRGLRVSGMCVFYQDRDLNVLMVENVPDFWPRRQEIMEHGDRAIFDEKVVERIEASKRSVLAGGHAGRLEVPVFKGTTQRWFEMTLEADADAEGVVNGLFVTAVEITDLVHREQVLKTLLREVSHRSKNLLAIIQSIAMQTARFSGLLDDFLLKFRGRIQSLSESQDLVTDSNWRGALFSELLDKQLSRYSLGAEERLSVVGDNCYLGPNAALHIGLALHELAVNSAVYGALADQNGELSVRIFRRGEGETGDGTMTMAWHEKLSHAVDLETVKSRFGSAVLEKVVPTAVSGTARYHIGKDTVHYELDIPGDQYEH